MNVTTSLAPSPAPVCNALLNGIRIFDDGTLVTAVKDIVWVSIKLLVCGLIFVPFVIVSIFKVLGRKRFRPSALFAYAVASICGYFIFVNVLRYQELRAVIDGYKSPDCSGNSLASGLPDFSSYLP